MPPRQGKPGAPLHAEAHITQPAALLFLALAAQNLVIYPNNVDVCHDTVAIAPAVGAVATTDAHFYVVDSFFTSYNNVIVPCP